MTCEAEGYISLNAAMTFSGTVWSTVPPELGVSSSLHAVLMNRLPLMAKARKRFLVFMSVVY